MRTRTSASLSCTAGSASSGSWACRRRRWRRGAQARDRVDQRAEPAAVARGRRQPGRDGAVQVRQVPAAQVQVLPAADAVGRRADDNVRDVRQLWQSVEVLLSMPN